MISASVIMDTTSKNISFSLLKSTDLIALQSIAKETFFETFATHNKPSDMELYLHENLTENVLTAELANKNSEFYFLKVNECVVGYMKLNFNNLHSYFGDKVVAELERIYVLNKFQNKHFGKLLLSKAVEKAIEYKCEVLWLGVWEKNFKAIEFYKRNGFVKFGDHLFKLGHDLQTDNLFYLNLKSTN